MATKDEISQVVLTTLAEKLDEWTIDHDELTLQTLLINELGLSSIDVVHVLMSINMQLNERLQYGNFMVTEQHKDDVPVEAIVDYIVTSLNEGEDAFLAA
ncbi:MAG: hypothetical protein KDE20_02025 [Caldilineaceae bacterium]|nr:hypothetical protein [Caldilineaceae bacterium]